MRALTVLRDILLILLFGVVAGRLWGLIAGSGELSVFVVGSLGVAYLFFVFDNQPKGDLRTDLLLIFVAYLFEAALMLPALFLSLLVFALVIGWEVVFKALGLTPPIQISNYGELSVWLWLVINLWVFVGEHFNRIRNPSRYWI